MMWTCVWAATLETLAIIVGAGLLIAGYIRWVDWCVVHIDNSRASLAAALAPVITIAAVMIFISLYQTCCK